MRRLAFSGLALLVGFGSVVACSSDLAAPSNTSDAGNVATSDGSIGSDAGASDAADTADAITSVDASKTCGKPVCFAWPLAGTDAHEWVINNYVDLDPSSGTRDYMGGTGQSAKTYDGHTGIDIDVASFRATDSDFPVIAAAPGKVIDTHAAAFDRNLSCASNDANYVIVEHADGSSALYWHMKKDSVVVAVGDAVTTGQKLGVVGSSGCSSGPHLHFEVHDPDGKVVEPFEAGLWLDPPVYDTPLGFMDAVLKDGAISGINELKDPPPNITTLTAGHTLGVGLMTGGGKSGDAIHVRYVEPGGTSTSSDIDLSEVNRSSYWWFPSPTPLSTKGSWKIEISINSVLAKTYSLTVP